MSSQGYGYGVHFFKVILESTIQKGELKVPTSFARRHWQQMSNPVSLSLPNGTTEKVYWKKRDSDVWLCNGWQAFAKYLRLDVSHFVVFRYEGNSSFNVIVFGKSGLEIEYPPPSRSTNEEVEEPDVEIVEEPSSMEGKRSNSPSPWVKTSNKKMKITPKEEQEEYGLDWKHKACFNNSKHINNGSCSNSDFRKRMRIFHEQVKEKFHSKNDHFTCSIQKTYTMRDLLILPMEFSKPYLHMEGQTTLFVEDGTTWNVELKVNYYGHLTISSGWRKFLLDNNLKIGDVCGFEVDKSNGFSFKVTIYPIQQKENSSTPLCKVSGKEKISQKVCASLKTPVTPKASTSMPNDSLYIAIKPPFNSQSIAFHYIKRYVNESGRYVTLQVRNRSWRVKLLYYKQSFFSRFSCGWLEFVKDNGLVEGDTCIIKMVDVEQLVFQVSFFRGNKFIKT